MIDLLFQMALSNVFLSLVLAIAAAIVGTTLKRPVITHLLWLLVFIRLLIPPVVAVPTVPIPWMGDATPLVNSNINRQQDLQSVLVIGSVGNAFSAVEKESVVLFQQKHWLFLTWLLGSMVVFIWSMLQIYRFHRLLKKESKIGSPKIQSMAKEIGSCLGIKAVPIIHTTSANTSPMVWWIGGKVWVVIPTALIERMDTEKLRWILSHELAHVRRGDYMIRWVEWLSCVCFWWNPVTWWARYNLRANEELCCDALVLSSMKPKPYIYGDSLLKAVEIIVYPTHDPLVIASGINGGELLKRRIKMIVSNNLSKSTLHWLQIVILLGGLMVLPLGLTKAQNPSTVSPTSEESIISGSEKPFAQEVKSNLQEQQKFPEFLGEIARLIKKDDVWLTSVEWRYEHNLAINLSIKGTAQSNPVVADFMRNLDRSAYFRNVELNYVRLRQVENKVLSDFHITLTLDAYPGAPLEVIPQDILQKFLTEKRSLPLLLRQITATLSDAGLNVRIFEPGAAIPKDGYSEIPVHMEVAGSYKDIMTSLDAVRRMDRFVTLRDIEMDSDETDAVTKMSMTVVTYSL